MGYFDEAASNAVKTSGDWGLCEMGILDEQVLGLLFFRIKTFVERFFDKASL